jgi:hypothetical protein
MKKDKNADLMASIQKNVSLTPPVEPAREIKPKLRVPVAHKNGTGKTYSFFLTDQETQTLKSLKQWLLSQEIDANKSLIVRGALQLAAQHLRDHRLVDAIVAMQSQDGRKTKS